MSLTTNQARVRTYLLCPKYSTAHDQFAPFTVLRGNARSPSCSSRLTCYLQVIFLSFAALTVGIAAYNIIGSGSRADHKLHDAAATAEDLAKKAAQKTKEVAREAEVKAKEVGSKAKELATEAEHKVKEVASEAEAKAKKEASKAKKVQQPAYTPAGEPTSWSEDDMKKFLSSVSQASMNTC